MNLHQLRVFVTVAERGNVTQAATTLSMSQSAASAAIKALEETSGVRLFNRVGRSIELSRAGARFLPEARQVLERAAAAEMVLHNVSETVSGSLTIAASQTIAGYWLPTRLAAFHEIHPSVRLDGRIANTQGVEALVLDGAADLGLVEGRTRSGLLERTQVDTDQLVLVTARQDGRAAGNNAIDLAAMRWIVRERGSGTREVLEDLAIEAGLELEDLQVFLVLPSNEAVRQAVEAGAGATIISERVVAGALQRGVLQRLRLSIPPREFTLIHHRDRSPSVAQSELAKFLQTR